MSKRAKMAKKTVVPPATEVDIEFRVTIKEVHTRTATLCDKRSDTFQFDFGHDFEAALAWQTGRPRRLDVIRLAAAGVASLLAIVEGVYLSPAIQKLHQDGAIRGHGDAGIALERLHAQAEALAKVELVALVLLFALIVVRMRASPRA